ncbi:MAG: T9SS type A sorting domain-containing protein [Bacteroidales bacterium]|nr:T9SS type A sorting domain-containing protein [Bacteroidales bacterium]
MRRCYLLLVCLLLSVGLQAQNSFLLQYWLDRDYSNRQSIAFGSNGLQAELDFADLNEGLHSLDLQVQDTGGWSSPASFTFLKLSTALQDGEVANATYKCWVDRDSTDFVSGSLSNGTILLDFADLETGLHRLNVLVEQAGSPSYVNCFSFLKINDTLSSSGAGELTYKCWFDNNFDSLQSGSVGNGVVLLETSWLETGIHTVNVIVERGGIASYINSYSFLKLDELFSQDDITSATYKYWFDGDIASAQSGNVADGDVLLETVGLESGLHTIDVIVEINGIHSFVSSYMFYKLDDALSGGASGEALSYSYWFDEDFSQRRTGSLTSGNLILETDSLPAGIHYLNIQVNNSTPSALSRHLFYKEPIGGLGVCKYEYWLNEDFSSRTMVEVNPPSADFEIVSLMPMDTVAFNPMSMYFDVNEGSPIVYAQNKIHFRFWNNLDFFSDTVKTYVDMTVSRFVIADTIERNTTELIATPSGGDIHWFLLHSEIGDSIAFKADKGCALQLFTPSGERVMSSSGIDVLDWNSLTSMESGWYHLAVSNGSANNPNLNVSYFRLGKFDVVDYDVDRVGNGGYTNINYVGNGFDSLNTVMYINALNDTVTHVQIGHETNNHTSVLFNFSGADTGVYRAVFLFNDYVLTIDSALTIETARDIILTSNVSFPESYLRNSTVTYTLNITNTGNMTAYNIPFYAYIGSPNDSSISYIKFDGLGLPNIFENILDSIPENEREEWLRVGEEVIGDKHYFISNRGIDEETGDSVSVLSGYFLITIAPYETKTLSLNITSNGIVDVWFTIPDTIAVQSTAPQMQYSDSIPPTMMASSVFNQYFCCWKDRIDCAFNIVGGFLNIAEALAVAGQIAGLSISTTGAGATLGLMLAGVSVTTEILANLSSCIVSKIRDKVDDIAETNCMGDEFVTPYDNAFFKGFSTTQSVIGCLSGFGIWRVIIDALGSIAKVGKFIKALDCVLNGSSIFNNFTFEANAAFNECRVGFTQKKPNCPPKNPKGGKSNPVNSFDPNEIYGYIAESGSLAVGSEVEELFYTIQFENDTVFASSNASNVYLIDSLDSDLFDLSSFGARKVIIGSKEITLNGEKELVRTMDMRPDINCLAQISLTFDSVNGVANWVFSTLDPITLEEINIPNRGFLPVNYYGEGIGEVMFTINRKNNLVDSTLIPNYATIIFDNNEGINTSIWQNVVDVTPPQSSVSNITITDTMALLTVQATDNISGVWKYDVFAQYGANAEWEKVGEDIPIDSMISVRVYEGMNTGFVSIAIDSAGNVENKPLLRDNDIFALHVYSETNETQGYVNGLGSYDSLSVVELTAIANACYQFVSWNDGNTNNPRTFTLTKDTTFTALFEEIEFNTPISATICEGQVYNENGFNVSEAGVYTQTLTSVNGCDSIVTLTLNVNPIFNTELSATICEGSVYTENGFNVSETGVYTQTHTSVNGCDSIVTLTVSVNPTFDTTINATINPGETYAEFGFNESEAGTYVQNLQTEAGCDSTITLILTVNSSLLETEIEEISFYPNPTDSKVNFSQAIEKVEVIDLTGKAILTFSNVRTINIESLASGAYYLRLTNDEKTIMQKVIKQ